MPANPNDLGPSSDFSPVATRYDATRHIPKDRLLACYDRLVAENLFPARGRILDAGCGTGQISLPLAERGYAVAGYDISAAMVRIAQSKCRPGWDARYAVADIRALPAGEGAFDAAVVSKLFLQIADWQAACRALIRAVRPGGAIVHIRDRGALGDAVRLHFTGRIRAAGYEKLFLGPDPRGSTDLVDFMAAQGCPPVPVEMSDIGWRFESAAADTLRALRERLFAEFWYVPESVYAGALAETEAWVTARPGGAERTQTMTPYLALDVFRVGGADR